MDTALRTPAYEHMQRTLSRCMPCAGVAQLPQIEPGEQWLSGAEQHRPKREVHVIDETGAEILTDRGGTAADSNVASAGRGPGLLQRSMDPVGRAADASHARRACERTSPSAPDR